MAIDLSTYDLPVVPDAATGLYDLPDEQAAFILTYAQALWAGKAAGVCGEPVGNPRVFFHKVIGDRVNAARGGDGTWTIARRAMERDMEAWQVRIGSRAVRALRRDSSTAMQERANAMMAVVREARSLLPDQVEELGRVFEEAVRRDLELAEAALEGIRQPVYGTLRYRALRVFGETPGATRVRKVLEKLSNPVWHAGVGAFLGPDLPDPYQAILRGPWDQVVLGDRTTLEHAWTDEAQRLRENFLDLPPDADRDPDDDF